MRRLAIGVKAWVEHLAFSPDGSRLAVAAGGVLARVLSPTTGKQARLLKDSKYASQVAFVAGGVLATGPGFGVSRWDAAAEPHLLWDGYTWLDGPGLGVSPDGSRFVVVTPTAEHALACRSADDGRVLWTAGDASRVGDRAGVWFTPDGGRVFLVCDAGVLTFAGDDGRLLAEFPAPARPPTRGYRAAFRPDGRVLAVSQGDGVRVIDADDGRELVWLPAVTGAGTRQVAYTADGRQLAAAEGEHVRAWESSGWGELPSFDPGVGTVYALAFSPDGTLAAAGGTGGRIALWDAG